jgi:predicted mannosyl-3-phosphoglycerate phosphatase (HAD superfamily)
MLEQEIERFTGELSNLGRQLSVLTRKAEMAKLLLKRAESELRMQFREHASKTGAKMTEKSLEESVCCTDRWMQASVEYINATYAKEAMKADVRALEGKERMLDLLGRRWINELRKDPYATLQNSQSR